MEKDYDWEMLRMEGRYDRLFGMFNYMRHHQDGICLYYSQANSPKVHRNRLIKDESRSSNKSKKSGKSVSRHSSQSKSVERGKSQEKKKHDFGRKKTNKTNMKPDLYTSFRPMVI